MFVWPKSFCRARSSDAWITPTVLCLSQQFPFQRCAHKILKVVKFACQSSINTVTLVSILLGHNHATGCMWCVPFPYHLFFFLWHPFLLETNQCAPKSQSYYQSLFQNGPQIYILSTACGCPFPLDFGSSTGSYDSINTPFSHLLWVSVKIDL